MFVLDTDVVSEWHKGNEKLRKRISSTPEWELYITIVTRIEIFRARSDFVLKAADGSQLKRAQQRFDESESLLADLPVLSIDSNVANTFDRLKNSRGIGKMGRADLLIACFVLSHGATLVTRNTKDFIRIPNLKLENWIDD